MKATVRNNPERSGAEPEPQIDRLRPLTEAARTHGIGRSTLARLLSRGEIGYVRLPGGERRIPDSAIREWIQRSLVRAEDASAA